MGIGQNVQKFDLQLYLRSRFIDKGYKVSQIGTKKISGLFGLHPLPDFYLIHNIQMLIKCMRLTEL